ncbi:hypothetical protein MVEN_01026300 [Mycena venus]|uniref:Uncharacterized protein n=1 Tax=Mycena venus TaxID=2733690 RepID=A0A8H7D0D6_9AGAR|nr:hypothetical protein MVEN_01026300 [Mycena venus]
MPARTLKRSRIPQQEVSIVSPDVKIEATQDGVVPSPPPKRRRKNGKRVSPPPSIVWTVVESISTPPGSLPVPTLVRDTTRGGRGRGRGSGRGRGRGRGGTTEVAAAPLHCDAPQATPAVVVDVPTESTPKDSDSEQVKPRQWSSSKEELLAILPELTTHVNGIALEVFETPIIILDGTNGITVSNTSTVEGVRTDLTFVRDFIRDPAPMTPPSSLPSVPTASDFRDHLPQFGNNSVERLTSVGPMPAVAPAREVPSNFLHHRRGSPYSSPLPFPQSWHRNVGVHTAGRVFPQAQLKIEQNSEIFHSIPLPEGLIAFDEVQEASPIPSFSPRATQVTSSLTMAADSESVFYPRTPRRKPTPAPPAVFSSDSEEDVPLLRPVDEQRVSQSILISASAIAPSSDSEDEVTLSKSVDKQSASRDIPTPVLPVAPSFDMENVPFSKPNANQHASQYISTPAPPAALPFKTADNSELKNEERPAIISSPPEISTVPRPIPKEMQALVDAYIHSTPVLCIASNACMTESWGVTLPSEVQYAYLGFHTVVNVQEERVSQDGRHPASSELAGRVKWKFRLQWSSGGEEDLDLPSDTLPETTSPWWLPPPSASEATVANPVSTTSFDDSDASTPEYKQRRLQSRNYHFRDIPIANRCPSILPLHLLVPHNDTTGIGFGPDEVVEEYKGWYCVECGKLNRVTMMRHRRCGSSFCASKCSNRPEASGGYAVPLESIRTPHEAAPVYRPNTTLPLGVDEPTITEWSDGMMVFRYILGPNQCPLAAVEMDHARLQSDAEGAVSARHIFTGNVPSLQLDATELLASIQIGCELARDAYNSPYFSHTAVMEPDARWPECLMRAREVITRSIKTYIRPEDQEMDIQRLLVKGWVDSGRRGDTNLINVVGSGHCAAIMCLGHDLKLKISPKSPDLELMTSGVLLKIEDDAVDGVDSNFRFEKTLAEGEKPRKRRKLKAEDRQDLKLGGLDDGVLEPSPVSTPTNEAGISSKRKYIRKVKAEVLEDQKLGSLDGGVVDPSHSSRGAVIRVKPKYTRKIVPPPAVESQRLGALDREQEPSSVSTPAEKVSQRKKTAPSPFIVTLVHGDILFLSGGEFEYSIVRSGTSILLVAFGQ